MAEAKRLSHEKPDARASKVTRRLWLKERVYNSRALQQLYASWSDVQARKSLARGQIYEAAKRMLDVWRHLGTEGAGKKRVARVMRFVRENCYRDDQLLPAAENRLRLNFINSAKGRELRKLYGSFSPEHRVRLRFPSSAKDSAPHAI